MTPGQIENRKSRIIPAGRILAIPLALLMVTRIFPQAPDRGENRPYDLKVPVDVVLVPVTAEDKDGNLVYGLGKDDFEVFEDGVLQRVAYFSADPLPLSVAFLIDRTVDERTQGIFRESMLALVEAFSSFDEMAFYQYLESVKRLQAFTFDREALVKAIGKVEFVPVLLPSGSLLPFAPTVNTSSLDSAVMSAAYDLQRRGRNRRKVIFIVSNGICSAGDRDTYQETRKYLLQNGIVVYGIGQGNSLVFSKVDPLKRYAEPTGGEVFYPWRTKAFSETYQKISETARNQYVLGYVPDKELRDETYRSITVRSLEEDLTARSEAAPDISFLVIAERMGQLSIAPIAQRPSSVFTPFCPARCRILTWITLRCP